VVVVAATAAVCVCVRARACVCMCANPSVSRALAHFFTHTHTHARTPHAIVQCMHKVPELSQALTSFVRTQPPGASADPGVELVRAMSLVFQVRDSTLSVAMIQPFMLP
jgi:hypothetical protein